MSTYEMPDDAAVVTDHDPDTVVWVTGNVTAVELTGFDRLTAEPGQTHRTTGMLGIDASHDSEQRAFPTYPARSDAISVLDPTCPAEPGDWQAFALVPAQVVDGFVRPAGDPWADLMCALALVQGRPGTNATDPFWCEHDTLHLNADPYDFSDAEADQLRSWGFIPDGDGGFRSYRFGSA